MNKEDCFELLKWLIIEFRDKSKTYDTNPRLKQDWIAKQQYVQNNIKQLNEKDTQWMEAQYKEFHEKEVKNRLK